MGPRRSGLEISLPLFLASVETPTPGTSSFCFYTVQGPTLRPSPERGSQLGSHPGLHLLPSGQAQGLEKGEVDREGGMRVQVRSGREGGVPAAEAQPRTAGTTSVSPGEASGGGKGARRGSQATPDALTSPGRPTSPARGGWRRLWVRAGR